MDTTPEQLVKRPDPLFGNQTLALSADYYPLGFPLRLSTNSRDVLESAEESWGGWRAEFDRRPITLRISVQPEGVLAPPAVFRRSGHLLSIVSDAANFAAADLRELDGCAFVSEQTAKDHTWLRWHFVEGLGYMLLAQRYAVPVHAACVTRNGRGVLLCGASGAGKSTLSFACARAGWTFVSDDATWLLPQDESTVIGRPHRARFRPDAARWFPELQRFEERVRPSGKLGLEAPLEMLPEIRTTARCAVHAVVLLDRQGHSRPRLETADPTEVFEGLRSNSCSYGEEVDRLHDCTARKLTKLPAYRLHYQRLEDGVALLSKLTG